MLFQSMYTRKFVEVILKNEITVVVDFDSSLTNNDSYESKITHRKTHLWIAIN